METKIRSIYSKVGQEIIYSILLKLLNYRRINKPQKYDKPMINIINSLLEIYSTISQIAVVNQSKKSLTDTLSIKMNLSNYLNNIKILRWFLVY